MNASLILLLSLIIFPYFSCFPSSLFICWLGISMVSLVSFNQNLYFTFSEMVCFDLIFSFLCVYFTLELNILVVNFCLNPSGIFFLFILPLINCFNFFRILKSHFLLLHWLVKHSQNRSHWNLWKSDRQFIFIFFFN